MPSTTGAFGFMHSHLSVRTRGANSLVLAGCGFTVLYVALDWVSFIHGYKGLLITPWSPGIGVLFAFIVQGSVWRGLLLFAAAICSEILIGHNALGVYVAVATAGIVAMGYTAAATIARQNFKADFGQPG